MSYIEFNNVVKRYGSGAAEIRALDGASFSVEKGELAVILGASGAGKTTALNILGGMDSATDGSVLIDGQDIARSSESQLVEYRRAAVGFVFQFYNLVPNLTALENVELASQICPDSLNAAETLCRVGLEKRLNNFPAQLSGGEEQRVDADDQGDQQHDNGYGARQVDHQQRGCADRDGGHVVERSSHAAPQVGCAQELRYPDEHRGIERHEHARAQEVDDLSDNVRPACLHPEHCADREQHHPEHGDAQVTRPVQVLSLIHI